MSYSVPAPAKINLALHVVGQRSDGYHLLETLVVFADFGDRIQVEDAERDHFTIEGPYAADLDASAPNLVTRARDALRRETNKAAAPLAIRLEKNLPVASGIGGGSADAAATLNAIAALRGIEPALLTNVAPSLGADVPMCLAGAPLLARGAGERIEPLNHFPALDLVLVNPGVAESTPAVFSALATKHNPPLPTLPAIAAARDAAGWLATAANHLQPPAVALEPAIDAALDEITQSGALLARMSGSGATCFGLYADRASAEHAAHAILTARPGWFIKAVRTGEARR